MYLVNGNDHANQWRYKNLNQNKNMPQYWNFGNWKLNSEIGILKNYLKIEVLKIKFENMFFYLFIHLVQTPNAILLLLNHFPHKICNFQICFLEV